MQNIEVTDTKYYIIKKYIQNKRLTNRKNKNTYHIPFRFNQFESRENLYPRLRMYTIF